MQYTVPLPDGAKVLDSEQAKLADGRIVKINGKGRWVRESDSYYTRINGKAVALAPDYKTALEMEARLKLDAMVVRKGFASQIQTTEPQVLEDQIGRWASELSKRGRRSGDVETVRGRVGLLSRLGFVTVADLARTNSAEKIGDAIDALGESSDGPVIPNKKDKKYTSAEVRHILAVSPSGLAKLAIARGVTGEGKGKARRFTRAEVETLAAHRGKGLSETTRNHYISAISSFCRWLVKRGLLDRAPHLTKTRTNQEERPRRIITWAECQRMADAVVAEGKVSGGMTPLARSTLYRAAFLTMLRARALREMVVGDLRLDGPNPHIAVRAATDKKRKARAVPLAPDTARDLALVVKGKSASDPVWDIPEKIVQVLHKDLRLAGIAPRTDGGVVDLHAMRHSGASHLMAKGVSPLLICKIGGWTDTRMLLQRYGHLTPENFGETLKGVW